MNNTTIYAITIVIALIGIMGIVALNQPAEPEPITPTIDYYSDETGKPINTVENPDLLNHLPGDQP